MRLAGKVILVTGSATGIGCAIARRCAAEGARVMVHGRPGENGALAVAAELGPERAAVHLEDLAEEAAAARLVAATVATWGKLDGLVNNAALIESGNLQSTDAALFHRLLTVNTLAPLLLIQAALPWLRASYGSVLNIGSVNAYCGEPNLLPYSISKGALMTMTRNLGDTLLREDGVRVNQLNVGWVLTENEAHRKQEQGLPADWAAALPATVAPAGRLLTPEEIAAAAIFWLAEESGPVSGQVVEWEQYPVIGRNPPKDVSTLPPAIPRSASPPPPCRD